MPPDAPGPPFRRYNRVFWGALVGGLLCVALFNAIIDPYGVTQLVSVPGINANKPLALSYGARVVKSIRLALGRFDILLLGSSRAAALSAEHATFEGRRAFNGALAQTSIDEIERVFAYAADRQDLRGVVIGLDFFMFPDEIASIPDFRMSGFAGRSPWARLAKILASGQTLDLSLRTVAMNRHASADSETADTVAMLGQHFKRPTPNPRREFDGALRFYVAAYACFTYDAGRLAALERILKRATNENVWVRLFFSPIHARQLEIIRALGLSETFEHWKRDVVELVSRYNDGSAPGRADRIEVWDLSAYDSITTEDITGPGTRMHWYLESSHYRKELGDLALSRILDPSGAETSDFGARITADNVEAHLRTLHASRERYAATHPQEVEAVEAWARKTEPIRRKRCAMRRRGST